MTLCLPSSRRKPGSLLPLLRPWHAEAGAVWIPARASIAGKRASFLNPESR